MVERTRIRVTDGVQPGSASLEGSKLSQLAASHPFIQQESPRLLLLDVVLRVSAEYQARLKALKSFYFSQQFTLCEFIEFAITYIQKYSLSSGLLALGKPAHDSDDVWCLDGRGILTLAVNKETYEELGLVGQPLPWKPFHNTHVVHIFLPGDVPKIPEANSQHWHPLGAKQKALLKVWDQRRGPWKVVYARNCPDFALQMGEKSEQHEVVPDIQLLKNVKIPVIDWESVRKRAKDEDEKRDWQETVGAYFEWIGMACFGSERLLHSDNVDPYLAVYDPPLSFETGELVHVRWSGLLHPEFVQRVLDICLQAPFVTISGHSIPISPVTYIQLSAQSKSPVRAPRPESEDTWTLLYNDADDRKGLKDRYWILAESIGQWDARWG